MSPLPNPTRVQVRADEMAIQTASSSTISTSSATSDLSTSTPSTTSTQQSPCRPASTGLITDSSTPPLSNPPSLPSTFIIETPTPQPSTSDEPSMPLGTKLGLGMIPVILLLCCAWIFFLFWWRRRKARKDISLPLPPPPPPVPEKDFLSLVPSLDSSRRGSKVFNMAAFSTPIQGKWREAHVYGESSSTPQQANERFQREDQDQRTEHEPIDSYRDVIRLANSGSSRPGPDSPIDRTSPFRLKRGNTVRNSLGSEISSLWPSPPPDVWVKRSNDTERLHSPTSSMPGSLRKARFCGEDYETRTYASSEKYA